MEQLKNYITLLKCNNTIDDASLNELCKELLIQLNNSPDISVKKYNYKRLVKLIKENLPDLYQYNNINFATQKINANIKPVWEKSSDGSNFILTGFSIQNTQKNQ